MNFETFLLRLYEVRNCTYPCGEPLTHELLEEREGMLINEVFEVANGRLSKSFYEDLVFNLIKEPQADEIDITNDELLIQSCIYLLGLKEKLTNLENCLRTAFSPLVRKYAIRCLFDVVIASQSRKNESWLAHILRDHLDTLHEPPDNVIEIAIVLEDLPVEPLPFREIQVAMLKTNVPTIKLQAAGLLHKRLLASSVKDGILRDLVMEFPRQILEQALDDEWDSRTPESIRKYRFREHVYLALSVFGDECASSRDLEKLSALYRKTNGFKTIREGLLKILEPFCHLDYVINTVVCGLNDEYEKIRQDTYQILFRLIQEREEVRKLLKDFKPNGRIPRKLKKSLMNGEGSTY